MEKPRSFQVETERSQLQNVLYLSGELDLSRVAELRCMLDPFTADTSRRLVLNLRGLQYIDSTGIGVFVSVLKARDVLKAPFSVEEIPAKIKRLFDLTGITPFLEAASAAADASGERTING